MNIENSELKRINARLGPRGGRRNGSILVALFLGVLLIAFAPISFAYAATHNKPYSQFFDPFIFILFAIVLLWWTYSPDGAWKEKYAPPGGIVTDALSPKEEREAQKHVAYAARYADDKRGLNLLRWPFFRNRNWGLGNETIVMAVTVLTAAVAVATLLNEFDKTGPDKSASADCSCKPAATSAR